MLDATPGPALGHGGRNPALRNLLRAVVGDLVHAVQQAGIRKTRQQGVAVSLPVGPAQVGRDLLRHQVVDEAPKDRLRHAFGNHRQARHRAGIGHRRVAAVEQPELGFLEQVDVVDHGHTGALQHGAIQRIGEAPLDHPFGEGFCAKHTDILHAERVAGGLSPRLAGGGNDAVDHAVGEGAVARDPRAQPAIVPPGGGVQHQRLQAPSVVAQVVAGRDGQPGATRAPALRQPVEQQGGEFRAIPLLGDGQGDPACGACRDGIHHPRPLAGRHTGAYQRTGHLPAHTGMAGDLHRVQAVLHGQPIGNLRVVHRHAMDAPARVA